MIGFLFPASFENNKKCDEYYQSQYIKLKDAGFDVFLIDIDNLESAKIYPQLPNDLELIYRGWMLTEENYELLYKKTNNQLITNTKSYLNSHHSPNWYESVKDFTSEKIIASEQDVLEKFKNSGWTAALIKDFVKSLKTGKGSVVKTEEDINEALQNMKKYRGFLEGGIVLNKFVELLPETERRFFVLNGQVFFDSSLSDNRMIEFVERVALKHNSFFYSVDVANKKDGDLILIEIGDGQVSDITGWSEDCFVEIFKSLKPKRTLKI